MASHSLLRLRTMLSAEREGLTGGLGALWQQAQWLRQEYARPSPSPQSPPAAGRLRELRALQRVKRDLVLAVPASVVLTVVPGSLLLLLGARRFLPWALPATFEAQSAAIAARSAGMTLLRACEGGAAADDVTLRALLQQLLPTAASRDAAALSAAFARACVLSPLLLLSPAPFSLRLGLPPELAASATTPHEGSSALTGAALLHAATLRLADADVLEICAAAARSSGSAAAAAPPPVAASAHPVESARECLDGLAHALVLDDWLLRREAWLDKGLFAAEPRSSSSADSSNLAPPAQQQSRAELLAACTQRFLVSDGDVPVLSTAVLRRSLRAWLLLSTVIPTPLLLRFTLSASQQGVRAAATARASHAAAAAGAGPGNIAAVAGGNGASAATLR